MPSFSHQEALSYWANYKDKTVYRVIAFMESLEDWTLDEESNTSLNDSLEKLGLALDNIEKAEFEKSDLFIKVLTYLKASRTLRILQCLDKKHPGAASKLISYAEKQTKDPNDTYGLFLKRNVIFERLRLIPRIFSKDRLQIVQQILEDDD